MRLASRLTPRQAPAVRYQHRGLSDPNNPFRRDFGEVLEGEFIALKVLCGGNRRKVLPKARVFARDGATAGDARLSRFIAQPSRDGFDQPGNFAAMSVSVLASDIRDESLKSIGFSIEDQ